MYCVIQEIQLKKQSKNGHPKELKSEFMQMSFQGRDCSHYIHYYGEERFVRPIKKAYKISIHISHRENGKIKKKQYPLCRVNYYDIADEWFGIYDYCDKKIAAVADELNISYDTIYDLVQAKIDPIAKRIQDEFSHTEEYIIHAEHERITTIYAANKVQFNKKYGYEGTSSKYDEIYDVFGNLMNKDKLAEVEADFRYRQEYEEKSRSYQEQYHSNYRDYSGSSYSECIISNHDTEDKETLKQFYRILSKKFHPDSNPDADTSKQMQLLNKLKEEWNI